jgi:Domain of unknown function (DUF4129)
MSEVDLEPVPPLSKSVLALPFALIAALAWSDWVLLPALLFALLVVFAFRQNRRLNRYSSYASIYAAVLVFMVPPWTGSWLLERLPMYFVLLCLAHLIGLAFDGARGGTFWAWLAPLMIFVVQPSALGLVALFGFAMLGALENRASRLGVWVGSRSGVVVVAGFVLISALILLPLARPGGKVNGQGHAAPITVSASQNPGQEMDVTQNPSAQKQVRATATPPKILELFNRSFVLINIAMLTFLVCLTVLIVRSRFRGERQTSPWEDVLPLVAAAILGLVVLLYGASAPDGAAISQSVTANQGQGQTASRPSGDGSQESILRPVPEPSENPWPTVIIAVLTVLSIAWVMLRNGTKVDQENLEPLQVDVIGPEAATNRVRLAYRAFLALCVRAGIGRLEAETPLEFAARVGTVDAAAGAAALDLTRLYEPVRYGGLADTLGVRQAEQALEVVRRSLTATFDSPGQQLEHFKGGTT